MNGAALLRHSWLNGWPFFWCITGLISVAMLQAMADSDLRQAEQISALIAHSVRWSVPWLYLAFSASALQQLVGNELTRWLLRNRKIVGLCFAAGMAWQLFFILWLTLVHSEYYMQEVYVLRDAIEGLAGYLLLIAMTVTSFKRTRAMLKPRQWKLLHKCGIYWLWAYAFSVYWHALFYYTGPQWNYQPSALEYLYYATGLLAILLRMAAWSARETEHRQPQSGSTGSLSMPVLAAWALILIGLAATVLGTFWGLAAYDQFWDTQLFAQLEKWMPYWPFIPFLPLFIVLSGAALRIRLLRSAPGSP